MTIAPVKKERGRPSTAELPLSSKCKQALSLKAQGMSWKDCAAEIDVAYKTLRGWVKNSPEALEYLDQQEEENQEQLNESYRILTGLAPEAAEKLIELIQFFLGVEFRIVLIFVLIDLYFFSLLLVF